MDDPLYRQLVEKVGQEIDSDAERNDSASEADSTGKDYGEENSLKAEIAVSINVLFGLLTNYSKFSKMGNTGPKGVLSDYHEHKAWQKHKRVMENMQSWERLKGPAGYGSENPNVQ